MTNQEQEILHKLETRVRQLILQDKGLREQISDLKQQIDERDSRARKLEKEREEIAQQYANLKMARMLELSDSDTRNARQRLNHLVREVDKCIALLKA
ncbi:MAG: hypothetical protein J5671_06210 [Bacteroidaceae bacterium]|nr:hypothetical protein [Bacteroidaceae bacterium]